MDPKNPDVLIAAMWTTERKPWTIESGSTEGGMFRTTNGGDTWTKLGGGLPDKVMVGRIGVAISGADPKRVYAQVEAGNDLGGVYISNDGGITWTPGFKGPRPAAARGAHSHRGRPRGCGHGLRSQCRRVEVHGRRQDVRQCGHQLA
ncbi:MAG: hypothetical protein IPL75_13925 [Acidobacteria bacterium]|nr:hypothetical protein [Acidobacteriota bacterium]